MFFGLHLPLCLHVLRLADYLVDWEDDMVVDVHASATNAKRLDTLRGTAPRRRTISVVSPKHKVCSFHDAFDICINLLPAASRDQFHSKSAVHYHIGSDNSSVRSASIWGQMMQHPWFPAPPATNAAMHGHMPWPYAFSPQVHRNGPWLHPFPSWNGAQPAHLPWPTPGAVCDAF